VFITGIILALIALIGLVTWILGRSAEAKGGGILAFFGGLVLSVVCIVIASMSTVPTRNVGIVTQFNKPTGRTTGAGLQWHAPWQGVDDWDASGQTYSHLGDNCVWVTIAAQRRACIPVQIEWAAKAETAPESWAAYKEVDDLSRFEVFEARRVNPQINAALTSVFASFDPLGTVKADAATAATAAPDLNKTHKQPLLDALTTSVGADVTIKSVAFEAPRYDEPTTAAIAAYGQKVLEARNLQIDKANAVTRAEITKTDASVDQVARCLQIAEKSGKEPGLCMGSGVALTRPVS
jgi:regulator of protease activity HflC (stomatin/prohibitin superfamily)